MSEFVTQLFASPAASRPSPAVEGTCAEKCRAGFGKAGCKVAVLDLRQEKAEAVAEEIRQAGGDAIGVALDARKKNSISERPDSRRRCVGTVDILVNGAGINSSTPFFKMELDEWSAVIDLQITSTFLGCQVFG